MMAQSGKNALQEASKKRRKGSLPAGDARALRFTSNIVGPFYFIADLASLVIAAPIALAVYSALFGTRLIADVHVFAFAILVPSFLLLRTSRDSYSRTLANERADEGEVILDALVSSLLTTALVWQFGFIENYSRGLSLLYLAALVVVLLLSRPLLRRYLARLAHLGVICQRIAFYGTDPIAIEGIKRLRLLLKHPHLKFVGVVDDRPKVDRVEGMKFLGGSEELASMARRGEVDQVFISVPDLPRERLQEILENLSTVSIDVSLIPPQAVRFDSDYRVQLLGSVPVLTMWQRPFRDINQLMKRGEDLVLASIFLIILSPVLAVTTLVIRLTSSGPAIFVQPRIGFNNEVIEVFKFRSMYADRADLKGLETTVRADPRITPVGRFIRNFSIDELPQLLNVLKGDMSLVGPRPHATHMKVGDRFYVDAVRGYAGRHRVRPGITGLAQVRGLRGEIRTVARAKRRVEVDKEYIDRWSVWLDIWILILTVRAVFFDDDAY
jgi:Undecaprenyl-phosphate glucose phosphotransferase